MPAGYDSGRERLPLLPLSIVGLLMAVGAAVQGSFSTVQESAKADIGLTDVDLGLVQGLATAIPMTFLLVPMGLLADRIQRTRLMALLAISWSAGTLLTAVSHGFAVLFLARMLTGFGSMCAVPVGLSIVADLCDSEKRGRAMLFPAIGRWIGAAGAFVIVGWLFGLLSHYKSTVITLGLSPWRGLHLVLGALSFALILSLIFLREPARRERDVTRLSLSGVIPELARRRAFLIPLVVGFTAAMMADTSASIWAAPILTRQFHLRPDQFGGWMGLVVFGSGLFGTLVGGLMADIDQTNAGHGGMLRSALVAIALSVPASLFAIAPNAASFGILLAILLFCGAIIGVVTSTVIAVLMPNELRGLSIGGTLMVGGVIGLGLAPTLVTWISGLLGGEQYLGMALAMTTVGASLVSLFAYLQAMRRVPKQRAVAPESA